MKSFDTNVFEFSLEDGEESPVAESRKGMLALSTDEFAKSEIERKRDQLRRYNVDGWSLSADGKKDKICVNATFRIYDGVQDTIAHRRLVMKRGEFVVTVQNDPILFVNDGDIRVIASHVVEKIDAHITKCVLSLDAFDKFFPENPHDFAMKQLEGMLHQDFAAANDRVQVQIAKILETDEFRSAVAAEYHRVIREHLRPVLARYPGVSHADFHRIMDEIFCEDVHNA